MSQDAKTQIRIEGHPETDPLIAGILTLSERMGIKPTTTARILIKEAMELRKGPRKP